MPAKQRKRGPGKPQGMNLAQKRAWENAAFDELVKSAAWDLFLHWQDNLVQQCVDAAFIAADDVFRMRPDRCGEFGGKMLEYIYEIVDLINADYEDDKDLVYSRAKIDQRLEEICGSQFQAWEERYEVRGPDGFNWPACPACQLSEQDPDRRQQFCGVCGRPLTQKGKRIFAQRAFECLRARVKTKGEKNEYKR